MRHFVALDGWTELRNQVCYALLLAWFDWWLLCISVSDSAAKLVLFSALSVHLFVHLSTCCLLIRLRYHQECLMTSCNGQKFGRVFILRLKGWRSRCENCSCRISSYIFFGSGSIYIKQKPDWSLLDSTLTDRWNVHLFKMFVISQQSRICHNQFVVANLIWLIFYFCSHSCCLKVYFHHWWSALDFLLTKSEIVMHYMIIYYMYCTVCMYVHCSVVYLYESHCYELCLSVFNKETT